MAAPPFRAPWWLANPHLQTIYGSLVAARPAIHYRRERWETVSYTHLTLPTSDLV